MKILIKGAGDLATGIACVLYSLGHQIVMTEIPVPLTVRRTVAFSRAVYEGEAAVEGVEGELVRDMSGVRRALDEKKIAVIVDEKAGIIKDYHPEVVIDAILAKRNLGTSITDAPFVIGAGPGFTAFRDCHCVIETKRGQTLGRVIWRGSALPNTGVPGDVAGYTIDRLIRAEGDGLMEPLVSIGDLVEQGQIVARTGNVPVAARMGGMVRGMLQPGVQVTKGLKIGDIDARTDPAYCVTVSDKARIIGEGAARAIRQWQCPYAIVALAAGSGSRFGGNKLLAEYKGVPLYRRMLDNLGAFPDLCKVLVTGDRSIQEEALTEEILTVVNTEPEKGLSHSVKLGIRVCLQNLPNLKGILFSVCDQPELTKATLQRLLHAAARNPLKIVCASKDGSPANPVVWDSMYMEALLQTTGDTGGRQLLNNYRNEIIMLEIDQMELKDIDRKTDLAPERVEIQVSE